MMATGHIKTRKTKAGTSYQLIVEDERDVVTGKRNRHYRTVQCNKKQAEAELRKFIAEVENGGVNVTSSMKVKEWIPEWLKTYKDDLEVTTKVSYEEQFKMHIKEEIGDIPINKLHPIKVQQWINEMTNKKGLSPRTVKNVYQVLSSSMKKAKQMKLITENPCENAVLPKRMKYNANIYNSEQIQNALNLAKGTPMYTIVLLGAGLGLRRGEITALKWSDVDFKNNVVNIQQNAVTAGGKTIVKQPKTQSSIRPIYISDSMARELKAIHTSYIKAKIAHGKAFVDSGCVLFTENGAMYNPDSLTKKWTKFKKKYNLPDIRLHDLRHSCATAMLSENVNMKTVQEILGHSDYSTTANIYSHVTAKMSKDAAEKMDKVLAI